MLFRSVALVDRPAIEINWKAFNEQFVEPKKGESKDDYMSRCISYVVNEGTEQEQAIAICESKWASKNKMSKFFADEEKRIISGPLMVADLPIYRNDPEDGEYYGVFTTEDIYNLRNKFAKNKFTSAVNAMHETPIEGVYMIESFLIDTKRGITSPKGFKLPEGSWFGSYKVEDRKSTRLNSSHSQQSRMPSSA